MDIRETLDIMENIFYENSMNIKGDSYYSETQLVVIEIATPLPINELPQQDNELNVEFNEFISKYLHNWKFEQAGDDNAVNGILFKGFLNSEHRPQ